MKRLEGTPKAIHRAALELTDEFGYDGWTMDHLADRVGVSRRTLFNHVPGKMDAVLGPDHDPDPALVATFVEGGPTGELRADLCALIRTLLEADHIDGEELRLVRHVFVRNPQVHEAAHGRFEKATHHFAEVLSAREGNSMSPEIAGVLLKLVIVVFDAALDRYLENPSDGTVADHFTRIFDDLVDLF
ncbi:TetR/AcrR family transcriptional regulator [Nocardioides sp. NPDC047086]|uniref:TetR/AcrR family transcriptional regulator n=1 Tax=Nocardioides sp. NPDC047086 TaxID=3154810 RepID=UPI0033C1AFC3